MHVYQLFKTLALKLANSGKAPKSVKVEAGKPAENELH
jgi:hypothetical protein